MVVVNKYGFLTLSLFYDAGFLNSCDFLIFPAEKNV